MLELGWYRCVQGLVLDCSPLDWERLEEFEEAAKASHASPAQLPVWLALDEIGDPVSLICYSEHVLPALRALMQLLCYAKHSCNLKLSLCNYLGLQVVCLVRNLMPLCFACL